MKGRRRNIETKYNTIQYNTIQYNTIQYNTIQYNTIQYNKGLFTMKLKRAITVTEEKESLRLSLY
jgi:hypothetical protein